MLALTTPMRFRSSRQIAFAVFFAENGDLAARGSRVGHEEDSRRTGAKLDNKIFVVGHPARNLSRRIENMQTCLRTQNDPVSGAVRGLRNAEAGEFCVQAASICRAVVKRGVHNVPRTAGSYELGRRLCLGLVCCQS
jgi:hypothetical protein